MSIITLQIIALVILSLGLFAPELGIIGICIISYILYIQGLVIFSFALLILLLIINVLE